MILETQTTSEKHNTRGEKSFVLQLEPLDASCNRCGTLGEFLHLPRIREFTSQGFVKITATDPVHMPSTMLTPFSPGWGWRFLSFSSLKSYREKETANILDIKQVNQ